jgi:iron complex outermembrane recepter protein
MVSGSSGAATRTAGRYVDFGGSIIAQSARSAPRIAAVYAVSCLVLFAGRASAQTQTTDTIPPPSVLKRLSIDQLMAIEVTSVSKTTEKLSQAASAIQVITREEIRRSGAMSIPEALRLAPNLQVAQVDAHEWAITARGFNSATANKLLVLIGGRSVYTPLFSGVFWDVQDVLLEDIDRIEVISGPGGALWGANAVNGVINIITRNAKDTQGLYAETGGGSSLEDFAGARYGGKLGSHSYFRAYGKYFDRGNEVLANGDDATDSWRMGQGGIRMDAAVSARDTLTAKADAYGGNENAPTGGTARTSGGNVTTRWSHTISSRSDMSLQVYYDRTHISNPEPAGQFSGAGTLTDDLDTYDVDFEHRISLGRRHGLVWGLGYRFTHDVVGNSPPLGFVPPTLDHNLVSGFVQDEIVLAQSVTFTLGTKLECNDYTGFEAEPTARLRWSFSPAQMVWAAVSRAVRTPSRVDRDLREPFTFPTILAGGPDFQSETLIAYELGYRAQLGSKGSASIATFYNDYSDLRSLSFTPATIIPLFLANNLEGETHGVELSATYQPVDWWRLRAGLDLLKESLHVKPGEGDINHALNETADPERQFSMHSSFDLPSNIDLDAGFRWVDTLHNNNGGVVGTVPSYAELDVRIGWRPTPRVGLSISGQNLLHDHHPEFGVPDASREEIVRSVYGKVAWRF